MTTEAPRTAKALAISGTPSFRLECMTLLAASLERELAAATSKERNDALRWRCLVKYASLGFEVRDAPSWNAVIRLPVFDHADQTITMLVDRFIDKGKTT